MNKRTHLTRRVKLYMEKYSMSQAGDLLLVGLSGGGDSVCLLCVLKELQQELGIALEAVHVHHGIRGEEADRDARFCEALCEQLQVPCHVVYVDVPAVAAAQKMSLEEAARMVRYGELEAYRQRTGAAYIAVAHHREDQAETVLWNLFRGSGLKGMGGMEPVHGAVIRPLLEVSKAEVLTYLQEQQLLWQQDGTNDCDDYTRNRIRHHVLEYAAREINTRSAEHICQTAQVAAQADSYLRHRAVDWLKEHGSWGDESSSVFSLDVIPLRQEETILQNYVLREAMRQSVKATGRCEAEETDTWDHSPLTDVTARHLEGLHRLLEDAPGSSALRQMDLAAGMVARREYDRLLFMAKEVGGVREELSDQRQEVILDLERLRQERGQEIQEPICIHFGDRWYELRIFSYEKKEKIPSNQYTKWMNYDKIEKTLVFRTRQSGDYILLPGGGRKTVKSYMIDEKIPAGERDRIPVIAQGSHVLWITGHRISEGAKVTEQTQYVLEIKTHGG